MARLPRFPTTQGAAAIARAVGERAGWVTAAVGAVLCVLGWYGVSGESVAERQLPYLASATIPGAALIVAGAVLVAARPARRTERADRHIETLYTLLVADAGSAGVETGGASQPPETADDSPILFAVPGGTLYHRRDCPLIAGKPAAEPVDAAIAQERSLAPCPVCDPPVPPVPPPAEANP